MGFWSGLCTCIGCVAAVGVCVLSAGTATPFVAASAAPWLIGGGTAAGYLIGNQADKETAEKETRLMQNQQYKDAKGELDNQLNQITTIQGQIDTVNGKINGTIPRQPNETDEYLRNQLIILTDQLNSGRKRVINLRAELDKLRKEIIGGGSLLSFLGLNKLSTTDKLMIVVGIILLIYLLKG